MALSNLLRRRERTVERDGAHQATKRLPKDLHGAAMIGYVCRVLIAEPNAEVRKLLDTIVRTLGWEPVPFAPDVDVISVDVVLLEPSFVYALELVEDTPLHERPPVVLVSVYPQDERTRALDAVAFLQKPFGVAELQGTLRAATAEPAAIQTT